MRVVLALGLLSFLNPLHGADLGNINIAKQKFRTKSREESVLGEEKAGAYFYKLDGDRTLFYQSSTSSERMGLVLSEIRKNILTMSGGLKARIIIDGMYGVSDGNPDTTFYEYIPQDESGMNLAKSVCRTNPTGDMKYEKPDSRDTLSLNQALIDFSHK